MQAATPKPMRSALTDEADGWCVIVGSFIRNCVDDGCIYRLCIYDRSVSPTEVYDEALSVVASELQRQHLADEAHERNGVLLGLAGEVVNATGFL